MQNLMRMAIVPIALAGLTFAACRMTPNEVRVNFPGDATKPQEGIYAVGIMGGATVSLHTPRSYARDACR